MASTARTPKPALELARRRGIYILPNLFTTLNLFAGFYAIVQGMNHEWEKASVAIFIAMVLDSLDGRVARLTRTQSAFGAEYDSLTDMVSFGAAPALVAGMIWVFNEYEVKGGDLMWAAAAVTVYAGITMVSSVKFYSGKDINLRRAVPFSMAVIFVVALLLISLEPSIVLWGLML